MENKTYYLNLTDADGTLIKRFEIATVDLYSSDFEAFLDDGNIDAVYSNQELANVSNFGVELEDNIKRNIAQDKRLI
jgi:hypothetical protein